MHRERSLAIFRLAAALAFIAVFPSVRELAGGYQHALGLILAMYALFSLTVLGILTLSRGCSAQLLSSIQAADLVWPALLCLFTGCAQSPFLFLFIFAVLAVSWRRNALDTLLVGVLSIFIVSAEAAILRMPGFSGLPFAHSAMRWPSFLVRVATFLAMDGLLAYSASSTEREQQAATAQILLRRFSSDAGMESNLREILPALIEVFEARQVILILKNLNSWRVVRWGMADRAGDPVYQGVPAAEGEKYLWPLPVTAWSIACSSRRAAGRWIALDRNGCRMTTEDGVPPLPHNWEEPFHSLLATTLQFGSEWSGRLIILDSTCAPGVESSLRLLQRLADEICPAVYNRYLWQQTAARVRRIERQRVARDLHDGAVQSLIATELQLELFRRQAGDGAAEAALANAQKALRQEVRRLREQIDHLRVGVPDSQLLPQLTNMLERFQQETGIRASFDCAIDSGELPRRISGEVVRIVEEALSNIRRHSGARTVEVHLSGSDQGWEVIIQDDGRGFDFSGRLSLAQLEAEDKGPRAIRERVHSANGDLTLETYPNAGARLRIRFANA